MAYSIYKADGTLVTVPDNAIDNQFYNPSGGATGLTGVGIQLNGRNAIDYGQSTAQTWLQMTENFSNITGKQPLGDFSLEGQLWYDKTLKTLYVRVTPGVLAADSMANWRKVVVVDPIVPGDGDVQVVGSVISIWANGAWQQIFPAVYS